MSSRPSPLSNYGGIFWEGKGGKRGKRKRKHIFLGDPEENVGSCACPVRSCFAGVSQVFRSCGYTSVGAEYFPPGSSENALCHGTPPCRAVPEPHRTPGVPYRTAPYRTGPPYRREMTKVWAAAWNREIASSILGPTGDCFFPKCGFVGKVSFAGSKESPVWGHSMVIPPTPGGGQNSRESRESQKVERDLRTSKERDLRKSKERDLPKRLGFCCISGKYEEPTLEVKYLTSTQRILKERLGVDLTPPSLPPPRRRIESGGGWPDPGRGIGG